MIDPFWFYLACTIAMLGGVPVADRLNRSRRPRWAMTYLAITVAASSVIFAKGALMVSDWSNPIAGRGAEMARVIHSPRGGMVVGILAVWPYALMAAGAFFGVVAAIILRRSVQRSV